MSEFLGSTTTQHRVNGPSSKIGVNVTPRFTVFQSPPNAVATYHTLEFFGSISMSAIRPVTRPGPIERSAMPFNASAFSGACACAGAVETVDQTRPTPAAAYIHRFIGKLRRGFKA